MHRLRPPHQGSLALLPRQGKQCFQPRAPSTTESPIGLAPFRVVATRGLATSNPHRCLLTRVTPEGTRRARLQFGRWALHPEASETEHRSLASAILTIHEHKPRNSRAPRVSPVHPVSLSDSLSRPPCGDRSSPVRQSKVRANGSLELMAFTGAIARDR
jgi:hypothetical protein